MRNPGFEKRQKELKRLDKQRAKAAKREQRKLDKEQPANQDASSDQATPAASDDDSQSATSTDE